MSAPRSHEPSQGGERVQLQRIITGVLLAFVIGTVLLFACDECGIVKWTSAAPMRLRDAAPDSLNSVTVFYLHGNNACASCGAMSQAVETVMTRDFEMEQQSGTLRFKVENYDLAGNEHFRQSYQVMAPTVLLVAYSQGKVVRWKNLSGIWEYALSDSGLKNYVGAETRAFLANRSMAATKTRSDSSSSGKLTWMGLWLAVASAFGLGILAAISPCALATNAVALAFLNRSESGASRVLLRGAGYSIGRVAAYIALGFVIVSGLLSASVGGSFLIRYLHHMLGPVLILISLFLFRLVRFNWSLPRWVDLLQTRSESGGIIFAVLMGIILALAFCPMSAALFFGGLLPLAVTTQSSVLLPASFGLATGLPVVLFAVLLALASQTAGKWFKGLRYIEMRLRFAMAIVFLGLGMYYSLFYVFHIG